jgi:predicted aldo/keto reductase-like oxidoreductase
VPIPDILRYVMYHDEHGKAQQARREFNRHVSGLLLAACTGCDSCARACPHGLNIPARMRYAGEVLG